MIQKDVLVSNKYICTIAIQCSPKTTKKTVRRGYFLSDSGGAWLQRAGPFLSQGDGTIGHRLSPGYHATITSPTQEQMLSNYHMDNRLKNLFKANLLLGYFRISNYLVTEQYSAYGMK